MNISALLNLFLILRARASSTPLVRKFDRIDDLERKDKDDFLSKNGYVILRADECFGKDFDIKLKQHFPDAMTQPFRADFPRDVWETVLNSAEVNNCVRQYLGSHARLDDMYLKVSGIEEKPISESWHDDNIGYRLKLFYVFDSAGLIPPTLIVPKSRPYLYKLDFLGEVRRAVSNDFRLRPGQISLEYDRDRCVLFDTNIPHRGGYSDTMGRRVALVIEYINKFKANALFRRGPCCPRQGRGNLIIPLDFNILKNYKLIDQDILRYAGNGNSIYGLHND